MLFFKPYALFFKPCEIGWQSTSRPILPPNSQTPPGDAESCEIAKQIDQTTAHREIVSRIVKQVRVKETEIAVEIRLAALISDSARPLKNENYRLGIPIELGRRGGEGAIIISGASAPETKTDPTLIKALARGLTWFEELTESPTTVTAIARRERVTDRYVSQMIDLAFLSPRIVQKALNGSRDVRLTTKNLVFDIEMSALWSQQEREVLTYEQRVPKPKVGVRLPPGPAFFKCF